MIKFISLILLMFTVACTSPVIDFGGAPFVYQADDGFSTDAGPQQEASTEADVAQSPETSTYTAELSETSTIGPIDAGGVDGDSGTGEEPVAYTGRSGQAPPTDCENDGGPALGGPVWCGNDDAIIPPQIEIVNSSNVCISSKNDFCACAASYTCDCMRSTSPNSYCSGDAWTCNVVNGVIVIQCQ